MDERNTINYRMGYKLGHSIRNEIIASKLSDMELGERLGMTRNSIYLWRKKETPAIRKSNLVLLSQFFNKELIFDNDIVEFGDIEVEQTLELNDSINLESDNMTLHAEDIIKDLRTDKADLRERISVLKEENSASLATIKALESRINDLISKTPAPITLSLDHNRMQFIVNTEKLSFVNTTQKYADIYGKNAFDIVNDCVWGDLVCPDDMWRVPIIHAHDLDSSPNDRKTTWKICSKHSKSGKKLFVESTALVLDEKGIFKKMDLEPSTAVKWAETNEYYESFPTLKE